MTSACKSAQEAILDATALDEELAAHIAGCEDCQRFSALQLALDERLSRAYAAPALKPEFRAAIRERIRVEDRKRSWDLWPALIAPGVGVAITGLCVLSMPDLSGFTLMVGLGLSTASYVGQLLFTWLTEELGEG